MTASSRRSQQRYRLLPAIPPTPAPHQLLGYLSRPMRWSAASMAMEPGAGAGFGRGRRPVVLTGFSAGRAEASTAAHTADRIARRPSYGSPSPFTPTALFT